MQPNKLPSLYVSSFKGPMFFMFYMFFMFSFFHALKMHHVRIWVNNVKKKKIN